jgi:hypothetical protein
VALCCLPATLIKGEVDKLQRETAAYPNRFVKKKMLKFEAYFMKYWMTLKRQPDLVLLVFAIAQIIQWNRYIRKCKGKKSVLLLL